MSFVLLKACISCSFLGLVLTMLLRCNPASPSTSGDFSVFKNTVWGGRSGPTSVRLKTSLFWINCCLPVTALDLMNSYDDNQVLTLYGTAALHKY